MNKKLFSFLAVPVLGMLVPAGAFGQTVATITTSTSQSGGELTITQSSDTISIGNGGTFTFSEFDAVTTGPFNELTGVTLVITSSWGEVSVSVENTGSEPITLDSGSFARIEFDFTQVDFDGKPTAQDFTIGTIAASDFEAVNPLAFLDLDGVTIDDGDTLSDSNLGDSNVVSREISESLIGQFEGVDDFTFAFNSAFVTASSGVGNDLDLNQSFENSDMQIDLIYTAIPEPSTYAAIFGALALGMMVVRRRLVKK
ncbi:MAG: PEP-CTERM sorting domain-containing protein [Opitutales bacterium]|nr:PEP-CTERM sorting domain-containing protein [Opitutales bacterium]